MKRKSQFIVPVLLILLLAVGCATGTKGKLVSSYELAGISLKTAYNVAKPACEGGALLPDKCDQIKQIYNYSRAAYLLAGDVLVMAIETDDVVKRQAFLVDYQVLVNSFTANTSTLIDLLVQLGIIKK